ncbi:DUF3489 domain-containing protein [Roseovarius sp. SYSU LYC5161]|uniref:DUF3489 domain-containing protein n=1 Tax=Roseovarius halophilus (ex Wu et al. 2025) TaxID=3376060 RepID=UPI00399BD721
MTRLTTSQISRLTAEITGTGPKGASMKEAAATRFRKVLAEAIGQMNADARADNILGAASFDEAADFLRIALGRRAQHTPEANVTAERKGDKPKRETKQQVLIDLLKRPEGATIDEIVAATLWQKHTARGAMSGAIKKRLGLAITSEKEHRGRVYRIT